MQLLISKIITSFTTLHLNSDWELTCTCLLISDRRWMDACLQSCKAWMLAAAGLSGHQTSWSLICFLISFFEFKPLLWLYCTLKTASGTSRSRTAAEVVCQPSAAQQAEARAWWSNSWTTTYLPIRHFILFQLCSVNYLKTFYFSPQNGFFFFLYTQVSTRDLYISSRW